MSWSTKWGDSKPLLLKQEFINLQHENPKLTIDEGEAANAAMKAIGVKEINPDEINKVRDDMVMLGVGYMQDGKHIPHEQVNLLPDYETRTIEVKHNNKKIIVEVTVVGDLALDFDENGWNIYHIPTLACFDSAVPMNTVIVDDNSVTFISNLEYDKLPLLNWMAKVQQSYPTSWQMLRLLTPQDYEDKGRSAKKIIQKWCLSVPVV